MESKLSNINCFMIFLLSISLLANSINGRIILDYKHGRELKEQSMPHSISKDDIVFQGDSSFISHSNPWANYWIYDAANTAKNEDEDEDIVKSKLEAMKSLINKEGISSFVGHLNPWASYWVYDNANKKSTNDQNKLKIEQEDLYEAKINELKSTLQKDKSFVGHLNPWANYWIYDNNANKKLIKDENNVKIEEKLNNYKIVEALKNINKKEEKSFVGHLNPWANYWIYDNANKKLIKDENNVKNEEKDLNELKIEELKKILQKKDKSFVGHSNPWANYWIYDNANKNLNKDENNVKNGEDNLNESKIEALLKNVLQKEDESFVGHTNPWANYWIYDNANKKSTKDENNVKIEVEDANKKSKKDENNVTKIKKN